jgi:O-antigen ligase
MWETPADLVPYFIANIAHNDWAQLTLETGVVGLAAAGVFLAWLAVSGVRAFRRRPDELAPLDALLRRAGFFAIGLLLLHSFVDYPLRTAADAMILALCCALLTDPPVEGDAAGDSATRAVGRPRGA